MGASALLLRIISRPVLIPLGAVALGGTYGTFKLTRKAIQLVTPGLHPPETYTRGMFALGVVSGLAVVGARETLMPPFDATKKTLSVNSPSSTSTGGKLNQLQRRFFDTVLKFQPRYRAITAVSAAIVAAGVVEALHAGLLGPKKSNLPTTAP